MTKNMRAHSISFEANFLFHSHFHGIVCLIPFFDRTEKFDNNSYHGLDYSMTSSKSNENKNKIQRILFVCSNTVVFLLLVKMRIVYASLCGWNECAARSIQSRQLDRYWLAGCVCVHLNVHRTRVASMCGCLQWVMSLWIYIADSKCEHFDRQTCTRSFVLQCMRCTYYINWKWPLLPYLVFDNRFFCCC